MTGEHTLFPNVKAIGAGQVIILDKNTSDIKSYQYDDSLHSNPIASPESALCRQLADVLQGVFERYIHDIAGRRIVIPLSGGLDSRLIAVMLKRCGLDDVLCFSYGTKDSEESTISRQVATALGYEWQFVEYSPKSWAQWIISDEMQAYWEYSCNHSSLPHIQDWPAIMTLKNRGVLRGNEVFIPGHCMAGVSIPRAFMCKGPIKVDSLVDEILKNHYWLWPGNTNEYTLKERLLSQFLEASIFDGETAAKAYENWVLQERQAKFIVNSVRAYEFFGFKWRLPLFDNEILDFFSYIKLKMRFQQRLYYQTMSKNLFVEALSPLALIPISGANGRTPTNCFSWNWGRARVVCKNITKSTLSTFGLLQIIRNIRSTRIKNMRLDFFDTWFTKGVPSYEISVSEALLPYCEGRRLPTLLRKLIATHGHLNICDVSCNGLLAFAIISTYFRETEYEI